MSHGFLDIAVTPGVGAVREQGGTRHLWLDFTRHREFSRFTPNEAAFTSGRDSFYMAPASGTGGPYVRHRGGPRGLLKPVDQTTLAFADYRGNRRYIRTGNLVFNDLVQLTELKAENALLRARMAHCKESL